MDGCNDDLDTRSEPRPLPYGATTSNYDASSSTTYSLSSVIPAPTHLSHENEASPPSLPPGSANPSPPLMATHRLEKNTKRATTRGHKKNKPVPLAEEEMNCDKQIDDATNDVPRVVLPGAFSVPVTDSSLLGSPNNLNINAPAALVDPIIAGGDRAPSLVIAAQLVADHDENGQDEELERNRTRSGIATRERSGITTYET